VNRLPGRESDAPTFALVDASNPTTASRLGWHDPAAEATSHWLPGVKGIWYQKLTAADGACVMGPDRVEARVRRPVARAVRRVRALSAFLGVDQLGVGTGALCEVAGALSANVSVFAPLRFGPRLYHVHLKGVDALPATIGEFAAVNFVTGSCLFSDRALRATGADGTVYRCLTPSEAPVRAPLNRIECSARLSLYELESACRLPRLTADMVALVPPGMPVTVTIDVPWVQYYLLLLEAFYRGFAPPELMFRWFTLADQRNRLVSELFRQRLTHALCQLKCGRRVWIRRAASMACLEPVIRESIRTRTPIAVDRMAQMLRGCDSVWRLTLDAARPSSYRELINLSYAVEQLRAGITHEPRGPQLCVAIDNFQERRTCEAARTIAAGINEASGPFDVSLLGMYPRERVFTSEATGRADLYDHDPGHRFAEWTGRRCGIAELLAKAYPDLQPEITPPEARDRRRERSRPEHREPVEEAPAVLARAAAGSLSRFSLRPRMRPRNDHRSTPDGWGRSSASWRDLDRGWEEAAVVSVEALSSPTWMSRCSATVWWIVIRNFLNSIAAAGVERLLPSTKGVITTSTEPLIPVTAWYSLTTS
jgi:hypothetical protein